MVVDILNKWSIKCHLYLTILLIELKIYIFLRYFVVVTLFIITFVVKVRQFKLRIVKRTVLLPSSMTKQ